MSTARKSALRQALSAVLLVVLTMTGIGRALTLAEAAPHAALSIAGVMVPICHSDAGEPSKPTTPNRHDCCDDCALCAPMSLPDGTPFVAPAQVEHFADHAAALTWAPAVARVPTPRLSQGPPAA